MASDYKKMLELKQDDWIKACGEIDKLTEQVKMLEKKLEKAEECLGFYATKRNWMRSHDSDTAMRISESDCDSQAGYSRFCGGSLARNYFKEKEGNQ
jgi:hypothetical protein